MSGTLTFQWHTFRGEGQDQAEGIARAGAASQLFASFLQGHDGWAGAVGWAYVTPSIWRVALRQPAFFTFSHGKYAHLGRLRQLAVSGVLPCPLKGECANLKSWSASVRFASSLVRARGLVLPENYEQGGRAGIHACFGQ